MSDNSSHSNHWVLRASGLCAPPFGDNVDISSGSKILGPIRIGDNVIIGANAAVLTDAPNNSVAIGMLALIKPPNALAPIEPMHS